MEYMCNGCGHVVDEDELEIIEEYEEGWLSQSYYDTDCSCGGEYETAYKCENCGNLTCESELIDGLCPKCYEKYGDKDE